MVFEPNNIKIERQIINIKNLPQSFNGIKIVQLSDFHSFWFGPREKRVLKILEDIKPDFIFITGDFVLEITDLKKVKEFWRELGKKFKNRIFAVLGNHDHWHKDFKILESFLKESQIVILNNENIKIERGSEYIFLIGVDDPFTERDNLSGALKRIEAEKIKILLVHSPDIIDQAVGQDIDLVLAGHTHGGQVNIPFFSRFWIPSKYGSKYASGLFEIKSTYLYVNRGIGTAIIPVRFNSLPEITLIELRQ